MPLPWAALALDGNVGHGSGVSATFARWLGLPAMAAGGCPRDSAPASSMPDRTPDRPPATSPANPKPDPALPSERSTVVARCRAAANTGKRHNSYWFTLDVLDVLDGKLEADRISLAELYGEFGGDKLRLLLVPAGFPSEGSSKRCRRKVVLRTIPIVPTATDRPPAEGPGGLPPTHRLLWSAPVDGAEPYESLERFLWKLQAAFGEREFDDIRDAVTGAVPDDDLLSRAAVSLADDGVWWQALAGARPTHPYDESEAQWQVWVGISTEVSLRIDRGAEGWAVVEILERGD